MKAKLKSLKYVPQEEYVFDIEVADNHNYYANNLLVHNCKNPNSIQGKNLLKLKNAKYKVGATGTLLMNNPLDTYMPLKWIGAESASYTNFKYYYCLYGGQFNNELLGYRNLDDLKHMLSTCSLRRDKSLLNLPPKTIINELVDMPDRQQIFYDNVKNGIKDEVDKVKLNIPTDIFLLVKAFYFT